MGIAPSLPGDFAAFWKEAADEALHAPLDVERSTGNQFDLPGFQVETLAFRSVAGTPLHGWIATPESWGVGLRLPAFLWVPPYGRESLLPNAYGTRAGFVSLSFNFHGHGPFHQEKYEPRRGYFAEGALDPTTWIFRRMFQDAVIALRVLQFQIEADEDRLAAMGMSQGGGISLWLGAWCPLVKAVVADMPFLGEIGKTLSHNVYRYPLKELKDLAESEILGMERVTNTVSYFDTVNVATECRVASQVSLGLKDPACRPETVRAVFEALPGDRRLITYPGGHDWHAEMVANNLEWLRGTLGA